MNPRRHPRRNTPLGFFLLSGTCSMANVNWDAVRGKILRSTWGPFLHSGSRLFPPGPTLSKIDCIIISNQPRCNNNHSKYCPAIMHTMDRLEARAEMVARCSLAIGSYGPPSVPIARTCTIVYRPLLSIILLSKSSSMMETLSSSRLSASHCCTGGS